MNERTIANRALEQLRFQTGIVGRVSGVRQAQDQSQPHEAVVSFESTKAQLTTHLPNKPIDGRLMLELLEAAKGEGDLIISDYINEEDGERFRESNINYLDNVGNAYLNLAPIYVLIQGRKPLDNFAMNKDAKLFTETGLRVIFALLTRDDSLNASYRKIADQAGVSMGTIGWVLRGLKNQGFIATRKGRYAWSQRTKLIKRWVEEYPSLRARFSLESYYTQDAEWWLNCDLSSYDGLLGGKVSASEVVEAYKPSSAEIFVGKHKHTALIQDLNLIPAAEIDRLGAKVVKQDLVKIEILNKFWGIDTSVDLFSRNVHPLLTYASLMDSWDPKSRELAAKVARQFL